MFLGKKVFRKNVKTSQGHFSLVKKKGILLYATAQGKKNVIKKKKKPTQNILMIRTTELRD